MASDLVLLGAVALWPQHMRAWITMLGIGGLAKLISTLSTLDNRQAG